MKLKVLGSRYRLALKPGVSETHLALIARSNHESSQTPGKVLGTWGSKLSDLVTRSAGAGRVVGAHPPVAGILSKIRRQAASRTGAGDYSPGRGNLLTGRTDCSPGRGDLLTGRTDYFPGRDDLSPGRVTAPRGG